ncbi:MAG: zinc ABC transporter substrate-binding protein [Clostridia bacterium]|nr:zinc ABC transporter substrate-binding protein [Clostridia bacterium]
MMRRALMILLAFLLVASLSVSCADRTAPEKKQIVTTVFPLYEFATVLAPQDVTVRLLLPAGSDLHSYEPTPQDLAQISVCDLFLYIGGEGDEHIRSLLESTPKAHAFSFIDLVEPLCDTHEHEHADSHHIHSDEHIWTSPKNADVMVGALADELIRLFPEDADGIAARCKDYRTELDALSREYEEVLRDLPTLFFGDRFPFAHLAEDYHLSYEAAIDGCGEHTEASAARTAELIDLAVAQGAKAIFYTESSSGALARTIAEECAADVYQLHSCHNLTADERDEQLTYLELMRRNLDTLQKAKGVNS